MNNYKSATNSINRHKVEQTIRDEIAEGNYVITNDKPTIISALGAIPKPDSDEVRLIHDCSRPQGSAVNDYIITKSFKFQTLDDAIKLLQPHYYMAKIDLRHAYRSVPIHPDNYKATGLKWRFSGHTHDTYMYDTRLPFGAKSSPAIFHRITQSVRRMMERKGFPDVVVYLDDFLVIGPNLGDCQRAFDTLYKLLCDLGFSISNHKVVPPTQRLTFLGVQLDTTNCSMTLPEDKLKDCYNVILNFQNKYRVTKKQLQRLAGKLNWACRVVFGGRTFLRRIIDAMNNLPDSGRHRPPPGFSHDIAWWVQFLHTFNGTQMFLDNIPTLDVITDACPIGAGGFFRGDWFYHNFSIDSPPWEDLHITHKETLAIILAAKRWGHQWENKRIIIHSDNQAAVAIINKGTTANARIMYELRTLFWLSAHYNFHITAVYIEGTRNKLADAISRLHEPSHVIAFHSQLREIMPDVDLNNMELHKHMSTESHLYVSSRCTSFRNGPPTRK